MSQILENLRDFESNSRFWSFSGPQGLIRVRGVVPYDVSRPLCVEGGGGSENSQNSSGGVFGLGGGTWGVGADETCRQAWARGPRGPGRLDPHPPAWKRKALGAGTGKSLIKKHEWVLQIGPKISRKK